MRDQVIVDTGPLVALLNRRDRWHSWACVQMEALRPPLLTCEAVLSEACFLLRNARGGPQKVLSLAQRGVVAAGFRLDSEIDAVVRLLDRYENVPMSLADACLVRLSELHADPLILTLDSGFRIYRRQGRLRIPLLHPELG